MNQATATSESERGVAGSVIFVVVLLGAIAPLATDMYIPSFPTVARELHTTAGGVELTLTTFFAGLGLGQLMGGPTSDALGRRRPLLVGSSLMVLASVGAALAPSIHWLLVCRFFQGYGGGWSMVIGRAVIVDLVHGSQLVRVMNLVMGIGGLAPIVAPLIGGVIQHVWSWRGAFWILAGLGLVQVVSSVLLVPESLPPERRHNIGVRGFAHNAATVLGNRSYVAYLLAFAFSFMGLFGYVAGSPFALQEINHFTPLQYSWAFAGNAVGLTIAIFLSARLAGRVETRSVITRGQIFALLAGVVMLVNVVLFHTGAVVTMICFATLVTAQGFIGPNSSAMASSQVPGNAGAASAVLGLGQSLAASLAAPITGVLGPHNALPMAIVMVVGPVLSLTALMLLGAPRRT